MAFIAAKLNIPVADVPKRINSLFAALKRSKAVPKNFSKNALRTLLTIDDYELDASDL
jgi:hypothetical protein